MTNFCSIENNEYQLGATFTHTAQTDALGK